MKMNGFWGVGLVTATVFGFSLVGPVRADDKEAKAILDKAIRALGGEEKLSKASAITWKTKGTFSSGDSVSGFTGQVTVRDLGHFRATFEGEFGGNRFKVATVLSGDTGWRKSMNYSTVMDATGLASEKQNLYLLITPLTLVPLKGKGFQIEATGTEVVGDKAAVVLQGKGPDGKDFTLSFDQKTGVPIKQVAKVTSFQGDEFTQEKLFSDYQDFDGIKRPTKIVTKRNGEIFVEETITAVKILNKVDPRIFTEPK